MFHKLFNRRKNTVTKEEIEEKKFVTNDTLSIEDFNQIVGNELARLNSMLLLDGGDNVELSPGIGMGRLAVSEYPNLEAYLTNKHFVAKTFNLNALILATRLPTLAFMQSSWASLTPGATLSYQDHPSNYHQVKQQIKAKVRIFSAVIEHSGKDREVAGILIQLIENIQKASTALDDRDESSFDLVIKCHELFYKLMALEQPQLALTEIVGTGVYFSLWVVCRRLLSMMDFNSETQNIFEEFSENLEVATNKAVNSLLDNKDTYFGIKY